MARDNLSSRHELFFVTALLATHASYSANGFRIRDVQFFIGLFSNWIECSIESDVLAPQAVQVNRYLDGLIRDSLAKRGVRQGVPHYRLTRTGVIELLNRAVRRRFLHQREGFFFIVSYLASYGERIMALAQQETRPFPPALKMELEFLLDPVPLIDREIELVDGEIRKLSKRIEDALKGSAMVEKNLLRGVALEENIKEVQRLYPYELNSLKPLSELMKNIQPDQRAWELTAGAKIRVDMTWKPALSNLVNHRKELVRLKEIVKT